MSIEQMSFLTRSEYPLNILRELEKQSLRKSELQTAISSSPSRPTVRRILSTFEEYGWTQDNGGYQQITSAGTRILERYSDAETSIKQLIEKAPWVQRLSPEDATFPVQELADAELVVSKPTRPSSALWTAIKLFDRSISRFRVVCSIYNPMLFHGYRGLLELGVESEAILDLQTYANTTKNPYTHFVVDESAYSNYQPFVLDYEHTLGIGIYDDRKVAVAGYNEFGDGKHIAMIISSNDKLVEWAISLYESYRVQAHPPTIQSSNSI
ncbi:helix-turn-helix transcriptional regulator [Natronococcus jeotgali]|uniref:helix-turn-helix transcriptional regulator n=1 Tax=Natronococcus jeotgali TaxID=413812 RepID=UPI001EF9E4FC|nr:hypothetical protein [Natronococcus jeotgali]